MVFANAQGTSDGNGPPVKRKRKKREDLLIQYGFKNATDGSISNLVPTDIMPQLFPKLRSDPRIDLMYDSQVDVPLKPRILMYSNLKYLRQLSKTLYWGVDNTRKARDVGGLHLFTVSNVTVCCKDVMPLVYLVLPNKSTATYRRAFRTIQISTHDFHVSYHDYCGCGSYIKTFINNPVYPTSFLK